jgi:hypothetical protein
MSRGIKVKLKCGNCKRWVFKTTYHEKYGHLVKGFTCKLCTNLLEDPYFRASLSKKKKKEPAHV